MDNRKSKNVWVWIPILGTIGFLLGLLGCASSRIVPIVNIWPIVFDSADGATAHTTCDPRGNPIIILNKKMWDDTTGFQRWKWKFVVIHEEKHVEQMLETEGGCHKAHELYATDPDFRLRLEMEAYCVEWEAMRDAGVMKQPNVSLAMVMVQIYNVYGTHMSWETFSTKIPCGRDDAKP